MAQSEGRRAQGEGHRAQGKNKSLKESECGWALFFIYIKASGNRCEA